MTKTQMKKMFKEMIETYKTKADCDYEMEIQVRYFNADEIFADVRLMKEGNEMDDLTQEFDFDGSPAKTRNFAKEIENFFQDLKLNVVFKKCVG